MYSNCTKGNIWETRIVEFFTSKVKLQALNLYFEFDQTFIKLRTADEMTLFEATKILINLFLDLKKVSKIMNIKGSRFFLSPAEVHFTQDSVAMCFQNENELNKTCEEIAKNNMSAAEFPNIRVLDENGKYFR